MTRGTHGTADRLTPQARPHQPPSTMRSRPKCRQNTARLTHTAFHKSSPCNFSLTRTEQWPRNSWCTPCVMFFPAIFYLADPSDSVTMRSPTWVSGWHAPLLKLTKTSIIANRDDTHTLNRLIDDLFAQLQERLACVDKPVAFGTLLTDIAVYFDRASRGAALATLQRFGIPSGTPFSSFLRSFRVVVASRVDKGRPLAPSPEIAMELIRIRTAQQ